MLGAASLLVLAVPAYVAIDSAAIDAADLPEPTRREARWAVASVLLDAGHAVTLDPAAASVVIQVRPPVGGGVAQAFVEGEPPLSVELSAPPTDAERSRLLAAVGPPAPRGEYLRAVALAVAAWDPALEADLTRALSLALLEAGYAVAGHRQAVDPRVCIAATEDEVRLSAARPGQSCGRVLGRLADPAALPRAALFSALENAARKLAAEARARATEAPGAEAEATVPGEVDDAGVLGEVFENDAAERLPFRLSPGGLGEPLELGWGLVVPRRLSASAGVGALARPPALDLSGHLEVRAVFALGITAGVLVHGVYAGVPALPVVESSALVGVGYEHLVGFGLGLRAGLYGGGRFHTWVPTDAPDTAGFILDPVVAVVVGLRYEVLPGLDLDLTLPLVGAPPRAHRLDDEHIWRREELGIGLHLGLAYRYDLPFSDSAPR